MLYRLADGTPAALYDRCPHRWAPLPEGHVDRNIIVCAYHGMEFNTQGLCTKAPIQHMKSKRAKIPSYAVREAGHGPAGRQIDQTDAERPDAQSGDFIL